MDSTSSTPPSHKSEPRIGPKSGSGLARITRLDDLSIDLVPNSLSPSSSPSPSVRPPFQSLPLHELLLLSPSPLRKSSTKSKTRLRLTERLEMAEDNTTTTTTMEPPNGSRSRHRRCKNRNSPVAAAAAASPRVGVRRWSRRRLDQEILREDRNMMVQEEMMGGKRSKRRRSKKDTNNKLLLSLVPSSSSIPSPNPNDDSGHGDVCSNVDGVGQFVSDLIMWTDVAKSTLWFGLGSLCFLSSCFATGINFSIFSVISQMGILLLGASFFSNSICTRRDNIIENKSQYKLVLKEDDVLRAARVILPAANLAISRTRNLFSGEPSITLKVAPFLLIGAEYGHLITLWRLCALGFFASFIGPKLYSCYSVLIKKKVEYLKMWVLEAWGACSHKKIVAASAATAFWNLTSIKTRIFAAFISLVILRYCRQHSEAKIEVEDEEEGGDPQARQALVLVETGSKKE